MALPVSRAGEESGGVGTPTVDVQKVRDMVARTTPQTKAWKEVGTRFVSLGHSPGEVGAAVRDVPPIKSPSKPAPRKKTAVRKVTTGKAKVG